MKYLPPPTVSQALLVGGTDARPQINVWDYFILCFVEKKNPFQDLNPSSFIKAIKQGVDIICGTYGRILGI
jgi:hypothetical protein